MKKSIPLITIMLLTNSTSYGMIRHSLRSFKQPCMPKALNHISRSRHLFMEEMAKEIRLQTDIINDACWIVDKDSHPARSSDLRSEIINVFQAMDKIKAILYTTQKVLEISPLVMPESNDTDTLKKYDALKQIKRKLNDSRK